MKKFKVVLNVGLHSAQPNQIVDGCLGNQFGDGKITLYDKAEAIKKSRMFGGKIKEVEGLHNVINKVSMIQIPKNSLLSGVISQLSGREMFIEASEDIISDKIYSGDVFEAIASEWAQFEDTGSPLMPSQEVLEQLNELAILIDSEFVQITNN